MKRITLKDIAKKVGVSQMTVSRVLNNRPDVNPRTRDKIQEIVREMGYVPNTNARALKGAKTNRIGIVVSDIRNPFYSEMVGDLEDIAGEFGLSIIVTDTNKKLETEVTAIHLMELNSVDYMILAPEGYKTEHLDVLRERGFDFLSFGVHFEDKDYPEVYTDDYEGGKSVGSYYAEIGIKKPLLVMGNPRKSNTIDRESGFLSGYEESGGNPSNVLIEHLPVSVEMSEKYFLENRDAFSFDGVFCYNDLMAMGAISAFRKLEILPGKDIPITGYDDVFYAKVLGLTTVKIPIKEMIRKSVEMIIENKNEKIPFKTQLIIRETA